ncbi:pantoate--beta-alanine ligase [Rhodocytophaga rosea]|uniref:Pantothenate synthetase n=1 Tax=Rhodocytophaga rosea TaxID=2704465 RepID=A0A6C0GJB9_9BACT|nr:pantoate--beta-alanine ligase [Rhodocytophaga rosea]QHT68138.1 pantoate--beta-alanine ligase [Rhodocytophaga rosea]
MHIFTEIHPLQSYVQAQRQSGKTIGFVPTMGALHAGHLSLISIAKKECEVVICSIYVNPTQFNNSNDLAKYPRTLETDQHLLQEAGCTAVFIPSDRIMYPQPLQIKLNFGYLETVMEGKFRPGHFSGVGVVVSKLFHMVMPDAAYFGQKDLQQFAIIRQLVTDLSFNTRLVCCPISREKDGLAMSSRNMRLNPAQRAVAPILYQTLQKARQWALQMPVAEVKQKVELQLGKVPEVKLEYFEIADSITLQPIEEVRNQASLCIAAYIDDIRLIDNVFLFDE